MKLEVLEYGNNPDLELVFVLGRLCGSTSDDLCWSVCGGCEEYEEAEKGLKALYSAKNKRVVELDGPFVVTGERFDDTWEQTFRQDAFLPA